MKRPIAVDFFCGAGGMSVGFERAGFDVVYALDYDGYHVATHKRNFPYGESVCSSITDFDIPSFRSSFTKETDIDLVFGGPPCQGFSNMGLRDAKDPRNSLVLFFAKVILELKPKAFVMENVPGLNTGSTKFLFERFLNEVSVQYNITSPVEVLNSYDFSVPQIRKRLFVLGLRNDFKKSIDYPHSSKLKPVVRDAIEDLPDIDSEDRLLSNDIASYKSSPSSGNFYAMQMRGIIPIPNDFSRPRIYNTNLVSGCMRTKHSISSVELYSATKPGFVVPGHKLPRLDPNGVCPTLRAGATSERGSHTAPRPIHPFLPRVISAREAARLHGYPDWFSFYPNKLHACRQIGNSVCPPVAHAIGLNILKALEINPTLLERESVVLKDEFCLPSNRPLQFSRIPVRDEFPKIFNYIWEKAFDKKTKRFRFRDFGPDLIRKAIKHTGANLPRIRPERFLYEAGQQRSIKDLIKTPLSFGYSITITNKEKGTGTFKPCDSPDTLGAKNSIIVSSIDLNKCGYEPFNRHFEDAGDLLRFIEETKVIFHLLPKRAKKISFDKGLFGDLESNSSFAKVFLNNGSVKPLLFHFCFSANIPLRRLYSLFQDFKVKEVLIVSGLTSHHVLLFKCTLNTSLIKVSKKLIFRVADSSIAKGATRSRMISTH